MCVKEREGTRAPRGREGTVLVHLYRREGGKGTVRGERGRREKKAFFKVHVKKFDFGSRKGGKGVSFAQAKKKGEGEDSPATPASRR